MRISVDVQMDGNLMFHQYKRYGEGIAGMLSLQLNQYR